MDLSKKSYLVNVILRCDFKDDIVIPEAIIDDITNIIKEIAPDFKYEQKENKTLEVKFTADEQVTRSKNTKTHIFKYLKNELKLEPSCLVFEIQNYNGFTELITFVKKIFTVLQINDIELKRLGLRYVNHINITEGTPFDWNGIIVPDLTRSICFINETNYLSRNLGQMVFNKSDYYLSFLYGWANSEFPNPIAKREFVLDYDCFTENNLKLSEASVNIERFHTEIKKMFVKSIGDMLKKEIGEDKLWVI